MGAAVMSDLLLDESSAFAWMRSREKLSTRQRASKHRAPWSAVDLVALPAIHRNLRSLNVIVTTAARTSIRVS